MVIESYAIIQQLYIHLDICLHRHEPQCTEGDSDGGRHFLKFMTFTYDTSVFTQMLHHNTLKLPPRVHIKLKLQTKKKIYKCYRLFGKDRQSHTFLATKDLTSDFSAAIALFKTKRKGNYVT